MEFYSHNYLIHHAAAFDWTQLVLFGFVALLMIFSLVHYVRDRKNSKYRELALIALFSFIFLGLLRLILTTCILPSTIREIHRILRLTASIITF